MNLNNIKKKLSNVGIFQIDIFYSILIFLLFIYICFCSPLMGDDWGNYINGSGGILSSIRYAINSFQTYEDRFFSRIFINILTYHKEIWNIINPLLISTMYFLILRIIHHKDRFITPILLILAFLLIDVQAFRQVYVWLAGNITYLFPSILVILICYLNEKYANTNKKILYFIMPIISFICSMFVETISVGIIIGYIICLIYDFIKYRKVNIWILISLMASLIASLLMFFSPGNMNRIDEHEMFYNLNLIGKIKYNLPNFIKFTFLNNSFLIILCVLVLFQLCNRYIYNKIIKYFIYLYITIIPILTSVVNYMLTINIPKFLSYPINKLLFLTNENNIYVLIYWFIFLIIIINLLLKYLLDTKKFQVLYFFMVGIIANISMLYSPLWGGRTAFLTTICLSVSMIIILSESKLKNNLFIKIISSTILIGFILFFIIGYTRVYLNNKYRENLIQEDLKNNKNEIRILVLSERFLWNPNPWSGKGYLADTMKGYYKINSDKKIKMVTQK